MAVIHLVTFHSVCLKTVRFPNYFSSKPTKIMLKRVFVVEEVTSKMKKKNNQLVQLHVMSQPNVAYQKSYLKQPVNQPRSPPKKTTWDSLGTIELTTPTKTNISPFSKMMLGQLFSFWNGELSWIFIEVIIQKKSNTTIHHHLPATSPPTSLCLSWRKASNSAGILPQGVSPRPFHGPWGENSKTLLAFFKKKERETQIFPESGKKYFFKTPTQELPTFKRCS